MAGRDLLVMANEKETHLHHSGGKEGDSFKIDVGKEPIDLGDIDAWAFKKK